VIEHEGIDPTAWIDSKAEIGADVSVGPHAVIGAGVRIGDRCRIGASVCLEGPTTLGPDNIVYPMASLGGEPQDLKYGGERTSLVVGARNRIREYVTINRGTSGGGGETSVGDDNLLMVQTHIGHDCRIGSGNVFANAATLAGHVTVGSSATIGAYSGVHQFCRVADHAFIGGYSVVTRDALPWVMTVGNRASAHGVNSVGLKRSGLPAGTVQAIKSCYRALFRSKAPLEEAMAQVEEIHGTVPEVRYFLDFVRASERGVCR